MNQNKLHPASERFEALFGQESADRTSLPLPLRTAVYGRMHHAFKETDGRKFKRIKTYFLKTFHPDLPDSVFTKDERQAVFITLSHIFDGEELS